VLLGTKCSKLGIGSKRSQHYDQSPHHRYHSREQLLKEQSGTVASKAFVGLFFWQRLSIPVSMVEQRGIKRLRTLDLALVPHLSSARRFQLDDIFQN